jgi:hypothetical protein
MSDDRERVDVVSTNRQWNPRLVMLTKVPHPGIEDGRPTILYIDPKLISCIERGQVIWKDQGVELPAVECTVVTFAGRYAQVLEAPEEVANRVADAMRARS